MEDRCIIDLQETNGNTSLFITVQNGHVQVTEQLIEGRWNIDIQEENGYTPLYFTVFDSEDIHPSRSSWLKITVTLEHWSSSDKGWMDSDLRGTPRSRCTTSTNGHASVTEKLIEAHCNKLLTITFRRRMGTSSSTSRSTEVAVSSRKDSTLVLAFSLQTLHVGMLVTEWQRKKVWKWQLNFKFCKSDNQFIGSTPAGSCRTRS